MKGGNQDPFISSPIWLHSDYHNERFSRNGGLRSPIHLIHYPIYLIHYPIHLIRYPIHSMLLVYEIVGLVHNVPSVGINQLERP